jgi:hypothetical protein
MTPQTVCRIALCAIVLFCASTRADAQASGPKIQVPPGLQVVFDLGPKPAQHSAPVTSDAATGVVGVPAGLLGPDKPHTEMHVVVCDDGTVHIVAAGAPDPCPHPKKKGGVFWWDTPGVVHVTADGDVTVTGAGSTTGMSTSGPSGEIRVDGGVAFASGEKPGTAGVDGAVLWGSKVKFGPMAGFNWVREYLENSVGGTGTGSFSTFMNERVSLKNVDFGARVVGGSDRWRVGANAGITVSGASITQETGVCNATAGCSGTTTTQTHKTIVGPLVAGSVSYLVAPNVGIFVEGNFRHLNDGESLDVNLGQVVAGITVYVK